MNLLKSIFIGLYISTGVWIAGHAGLGAARSSFALTWLGVALAALVIPLYFGGLYLHRTPRNRARLPIFLGAITLGVAISLIDNFASPNIQPLPLAYGVILVVSSLAYVFWYSHLNRKTSARLTVGQPLPAFEIRDLSKGMISTKEMLGNPTILLFYRGNWCPLCVAQIKELAEQYQQLAQLGAQIFLISPQPEPHTRRLANQHAVAFRYLLDERNQVARQLGIAHAHGVPTGLEVLGYASETVYPTIVITDANGIILFVDETDNYRVRPEPETFLRILKTQV